MTSFARAATSSNTGFHPRPTIGENRVVTLRSNLRKKPSAFNAQARFMVRSEEMACLWLFKGLRKRWEQNGPLKGNGYFLGYSHLSEPWISPVTSRTQPLARSHLLTSTIGGAPAVFQAQSIGRFARRPRLRSNAPMAPRFLTILTGRDLPTVRQARTPQPSIINEKTLADFNRVIEQTAISRPKPAASATATAADTAD
jgi:hypothetical protein